MTNPTIALVEYLRKMGMDQDKDFLAENVRVMSQMLMELEAQQLTGAEKHERTAARMNYRNGYRERMWKTRVGEIDLRIPKLRVGTYFQAFWNPAGMRKKPCWPWCSKRMWKGSRPAKWTICCSRWD
jgi:putative transposase